MSDYSWNSNPWVWAVTFRRVAEPPSGKPTLFSAAMVKAILRDKDPKTQTRRVIVPQPGWLKRAELWSKKWISPGRDDWRICPYGGTGDLLYVRECFLLDERNRKGKVPQEVIYDATPEWAMNHMGEVERVRFIDGELVPPDVARTSLDSNRFWHKKPSIHMPRWASRITLEITEVRVQRVQEISKLDAIAEGIQVLPLQSQDDPSAWYQSAPGVHQQRSAQASFADLWDSINAKRGPKRGKVAA